MARRTKEEAQQTRDAILDAAERVFHRQGVGRTSLAQVAAEAGVTRGAIYWHFANKGELFAAMMDRAVAPLESMEELDYGRSDDPIEDLRGRLLAILRKVFEDPTYLRVFSIAWHKCEYVDEMAPIVDQCMEAGDRHKGRIESAFQQAVAKGLLPAAVDARSAAFGVAALIDGIVANWSLHPQSVSLADATAWLDTYLQGIREPRRDRPSGPIC